MTQLGWVLSIAVLVIVGGFIAYCRWAVRPPKPKSGPGAFVLSEDVASCGGCGCLLGKKPEFKQPSNVGLRVRSRSCGWGNLHEPMFEEFVQDHYLCLRCQVDGEPLVREVRC
jgi:hypothetical protein